MVGDHWPKPRCRDVQLLYSCSLAAMVHGKHSPCPGAAGLPGSQEVDQAVHVDTWGNDVGLLAACQLRSTSGLRLQLRHAHSLGSRAQESAQVDVSTR
tara:strand:+ start:136 stop:429 length:294 start_codon:yes stop_codon:yes gene_type:complete